MGAITETATKYRCLSLWCEGNGIWAFVGRTDDVHLREYIGNLVESELDEILHSKESAKCSLEFKVDFMTEKEIDDLPEC